LEINQGYTTMHGQPVIKMIRLIARIFYDDARTEELILRWLMWAECCTVNWMRSSRHNRGLF